MLYDFLGVFGYFGRKNIPPDLRSSDLPSKRLLGKGLASIGYETEWNGVRYARKDFVAVPSDIFRQEAGVLLKLPDHENVVKTHGLTVDKLSCSLVLDYMDDKLTDFIMKTRDPAGEHDPTLQESLGLILQIARAMEHLHKHGILHGDLKSRNILVTYRNDVDESLLLKSVKVADFGLVQTKRKSMPYVSHQARKLDMVRWKAPEILMGLYREATSPDPDFDEEFTGSACVTRSDDAYCFGLTCFQILTGEEPYPKRNWRELVIDIVSNEGGLKLPPNISCPQDLRELVDVCCAVDPDKRPTFVDICEKLERMQSLQPRASPKRSESLVEGAEGDVKNMGKDVIHTEFDLEEMLPNVQRASPKRSESLVEGAEGDVKNMGKEVINAEIGREEMLPIVERASPKQSGSSVERAEGDVKNMEEAVTDKCFNAESDAEDLSYLNIPFESEIILKGPIKELKPLGERMSKADAHLDGWKLVEKGTWNGVDCAVKTFKSNTVDWNKDQLRKEIASLVKLRHPHVTQLIGRSEYNGKSYVLYEMMDSDLRVRIEESRKKKNVLSRFLQDDRPFSRARELSIITQIARAMLYMHEKGLVHGELKCTNILVKQLGEHIDVKVADLHCSRLLGFPPTTKYKPAHRPRWMPPEDFQYSRHSNLKHPTDELLMKGDVYSFAMTCYEVVTGKYPFDGVRATKEIEEKVMQGNRPDLPKDLSQALKNLIAKCWHQDPEQRPSFQDICHVLNVDAVHRIKKTFSFVGFVRQKQEPVNYVLAGLSWNDIFLDENAPNSLSSQRIDDAARSLPHYMKMKASDLKPMRPLASSLSAEVFEASWIGCRFAVKWLKVDHVVKLRHEVSIMMKLLHPHVVRLVGFSVLFNRSAIVMEMLDLSLRDLIYKRTRVSNRPKHANPFSEAEALAIIRKLALGMDFLHSRGVTHGDLKPANVLVRYEHLSVGMDVKVCDFGVSRLRGESTSKKMSVLGRYRAPEVIRSMESRDHWDIDPKAADVYSFAMVCYEVITGKSPFFECSSSAAFTALVEGRAMSMWSFTARHDLWLLLQKCWSKEPQARPKFGEVVKVLDYMCRS